MYIPNVAFAGPPISNLFLCNHRYEDILEPKDIYCLIALTAYHNNYYGICSRAFISMCTPSDHP